MATCDVCGKSVSMPYNCRHCGGTFCSEHRLPENHDCSGLHNWNDPSGVFDSGFDDSVNKSSRSTTDRIMAKLPIDTGVGGPLAYFRGNVTYTILLFMWVTFLAEWITLLLAPQLWEPVFVLSSEHPEYVWTWFTSIFAHYPYGIAHIAFNSIAIFFFGPLLSRYLTDRQYWALFLGAGALAGLSQVFVGMATNTPTLVLGASGGAMAILGVITILLPKLRVYFMFFIPMPLWILTLGFAAISLLFVGGGGGGLLGNVAHAAHLVGLLVGLAVGEYVKRTQTIRGPNQFQLGPGGPGRGRY